MKSAYASAQANAPKAAPKAPELSSQDLGLVLALVRGGTLAEAARQLGVDSSTVFRAIGRLEKQLGLALFVRGRRGMAANDLAMALARRAEAIEGELDQARELLRTGDRALTGTLRVTTTDTILQGLLLPALAEFRRAWPQLELELVTTNQLASLSRREADIAIRATRKPPEHLVGARLGTIRSALWASERYLAGAPRGGELAALDWVSPEADDMLAGHPSIQWRRERHPAAQPTVRCNSILAVAQAIEGGLGIGVAPLFLLEGRPGVVNLSGRVPELDTDLWMLSHADVRHLRRVKVFFDFLRERLQLS